jgi:hypothetical protein
VSNGVIGPGLFGTRCPHVPRTDDPGQGSWTFSIDAASTVIGSPIVRLQVRSTGVDAELGTRLWDLAPDGTQTLMSRGTYRFAQAPSSADTSVAYELSPTAWQLPAGHLVKLEVSGADWPYFQLDRIPAVTTVDAVSLRLPTTSAAPLGLPHPAAGAAPPSPSALPLTASMPGGAPAIPVVAVAIALLATWRFARRGSR